MDQFILRAALLAAAILAAAASARAQPSPPHLAYVYPAGAQQGETVMIKVGGQSLGAIDGAVVLGGGVEANVIEVIRPLTQKQVNELRERLQKIREEKKRDAATLKEAIEIRTKLAAFANRPAPALADAVMLQVVVDKDAPPGPRELRLRGPMGMTNPLVFEVGRLPEFVEPEAKGRVVPGGPPGPDMAIELPVSVNGQIMPGDVDRFRFTALKGQRLVAQASARALVPYLADAVPGWFQATLTLYDAEGREVAYDDDFRFDPDPVLLYAVPSDGEYVLEIKDAIFRGREDFVYRIRIGVLPFITDLFPLGGRAGEATEVEVTGWNLPASRLERAPAEPGIRLVTLEAGGMVSNARPFVADDLPEMLEREPNDAPAAATALKLPVIVNGRIDRRGDRDCVRFEGREGDAIVAEALARRLGSPLDGALRLIGPDSKEVAFSDDRVDKASGLVTHHADPCLQATLPADGTYRLELWDVQGQGGRPFAYRLRVSAPRPDFELRVAPSSLAVRGGANEPIEVCAVRRDGFGGPIAVSLVNPPEGFTLGGAVIPAGQDQVRMTLRAPPTATREPLRLVFEGRATTAGGEVVRRAVPCEDMMQAFAYRHLVPTQDLWVTVSGRFAQRRPLEILGAMPLRLPAGGTAAFGATAPMETPVGKLEFELSEPPDGVAIREVRPDGLRTRIILEADAQKVKPGLRGNLIVSAFLLRTPPKAADGTQRPARRVPAGALPAVPFEVVAP